MKKVFFVLALIFMFSVGDANAYEPENYITIVNPVRIAPYTQDPGETVLAEYNVAKKYDLPATWLLTYDSINDAGTRSSIEKFDSKQELGIYLEVTKSLAEKAGVEYNDEIAWHYPSNVFLSGYEQGDREKLIDTVFESFKEKFGYYPKSVGSWWTDAYSLEYMQEKYSITANLTCADQYKTDNYQIWGQYWSSPFIPSKNHAGVPASDTDSKINVVMVQWATREPLNGYYDSLFSTQDYHVSGVDREVDYFKNLIDSYLDNENELNQIVVGLEGDFSPGAYSNNVYEEQISYVADLLNNSGAKALTMQEFSEIYLEKYDISPEILVESRDLMGGQKTAYWYNTPYYRIGLQYNPENNELKINDLRIYNNDIQDPYYLAPNKNLKLSIYVPSALDEVNNSEDIMKFDFGEFNELNRTNGSVQMIFDNGEITLNNSNFSLPRNSSIPDRVLDYFDAETIDGQINLSVKNEWLIDTQEYHHKDLTREATYHLKRKRIKAYILLAVFVVSLSLLGVYVKTRKIRYSIMFGIVIILFGIYYYQDWFNKNSEKYSVHQDEVYALNYLLHEPRGKVLVYDKECLGCSWYTENKPAVFNNKRSYVSKLSGKKIVYSDTVFDAENQRIAREEFDKTGAKYIYLSSYGTYREKTPFSPGDLGIEKIFQNEYSEIWRVKE